MHYQKSEELSSLISGKRVVLVGPAQYLMGKGLGSVINDYDTVCTVNYMAPGGFEADYGDRTDIMFYNCATGSLDQMREHFDEYPDFTNNLKLVVCPVVKVLGPENWTEWKSDFIAPVVDNFKSINTHNRDFHWIGMDNYRYLFDLIACREPNTGILAISIVLEHQPKELFLTGFTFYTHTNDTYFPGYATKAPGWNGVSGHPQELQKKFFKEKVLSQGIKIDSYLNKLLKLNHNNVHNL